MTDHFPTWINLDELKALRAENARLRAALEIVHLYSVDDEHDYNDIEKVVRDALEVKE